MYTAKFSLKMLLCKCYVFNQDFFAKAEFINEKIIIDTY